ncbi:MAG TPA: replicative DNA helicase, partial [Actinobacteria bacterium]|nr:replicative DNA helicase [Actinomycetota bacterium]
MARNLKEPPTLPPHDLEAEESVLGAMLISPGAVVAVGDRLKRNDFYRESHRLIYDAIVELFSQGEAVDIVTVADHLTLKGKLDAAGGRAYIHTLSSTVPAAANAPHYADIVHENAVLRSLIEVGNKIAEMGYERSGEVRELLNSCEEMVFSISHERTTGQVQPLKDILGEQFDRIEKLHDAGKSVTGVPTGFADLDRITSGLQPSNLIVLAARPSMGKTSLALDIAQNVALKEDVPVLLFSLEMGKEELAQRMMCTQGKVDSQRLKTGMVGPDDWAKLTDACGRLMKAPIFVDESANPNIFEIRAKTRRLASKESLGLVIVDYLQLMMPEDNYSQNREQEIAKISRSLKIMARELKIPVLAISQLSRAPEKRNVARPQLSDLRESGAIEQDADVVLFIFRDKEESGHLSK